MGVRPLLPRLLRSPQSILGIDRIWSRKMGLRVHQHERNSLSGGDRKLLAHGRQPLATKLDGRAQDKHVRTGNCENSPSSVLLTLGIEEP
jgi:hypothetical protein